MIQRPQSILLVLVAIFHILLFFIPVFSWEGNDSMTINALYNLPFTVLNALIILFSIFIILQFKNRKKQKSFVYILVAIIIINIVLYIYYMLGLTVMGDPSNEHTFVPAKSYGMFAQLLSLILCFFAARRIKKDDDLVKSIDRIR